MRRIVIYMDIQHIFV